jgi:hypothetical protein
VGEKKQLTKRFFVRYRFLLQRSARTLPHRPPVLLGSRQTGDRVD